MDELSELFFYDGEYTGEEIDEAVGAALNPDTAPDATHTTSLITSAAVAGIKNSVASISITGTTNDTGATIPQGTYFYVSGALCVAKTAIADGSPLNEGTNYEAVTAGGLNALKSITASGKLIGSIASGKTSGTITLGASVAHLLIFVTGNAGKCAMILAATNSSNTVFVAEVHKGASISFTAGTGTVTVTIAATGNTINIFDIPLSPSGTDFATLSVS